MLPVRVIVALLILFPVTPLAGEKLVSNGFRLDNAIIAADEIFAGGPPKDGIPALTDPSRVSAQQANQLRANDRVLGIRLNEQARAYPIRILNWHEVINDQLGGQPVLITWCPLCGSGMVFNPGVANQRHIFGVSGLLYNSDVLLYDRATQSLWSQLLGKAISGSRVGERLQQIPAVHTTWQDWRTQHPDTTVLSFNTGHNRDYDRDPYQDYSSSNTLYFPVAAQDQRYHPKSIVAGLTIDGVSKVWPLDELAEQPSPLPDRLQQQALLVHHNQQTRSVRITNLAGEDLPVIMAYWFAWFAFYPDAEIYQSPR
jgi:Protein of unknown function (DUF3179)